LAGRIKNAKSRRKKTRKMGENAITAGNWFCGDEEGEFKLWGGKGALDQTGWGGCDESGTALHPNFEKNGN